MTGAVLVGAEERDGRSTFVATNPATGQELTPRIQEAALGDVDDACTLAAAAFATYADLPLVKRAVFLETIGAEIVSLGDALIDRAMAETALPRLRLEGVTHASSYTAGGGARASVLRLPNITICRTSVLACGCHDGDIFS